MEHIFRRNHERGEWDEYKEAQLWKNSRIQSKDGYHQNFGTSPSVKWSPHWPLPFKSQCLIKIFSA